jgi:predicted nucleic acid-binding protein
MTLGIDTNVLIPWLVRSVPKHAEARNLVQAELRKDHGRIAVAPQVCWEFLHVVTDERRFEHPCTMEVAIALIRSVWNGPETVRLLPSADVVPRVLELMRDHGLGRKRILDTALAAVLEAAGVVRLATYNASDFSCFGFLDLVVPGGKPRTTKTSRSH